MKFRRQALHKLQVVQNQIIDQKGITFDALRYSKFKYGLGNEASHYARQMIEKIFVPQARWLLGNEILITSSAYKFVPTASDAIAKHLLANLIETFSHLSFQKFKIHRDILFVSDYGNLSQKERKDVMQQTNLALPPTLKLQNKKVIVVDDVRITGAHEARIRHLFSKTEATEVLFVYIALFEHSVMPTIEHQLNHAWVNTLEKLKPLFENPHFTLNARICKFLLSYPDSVMLQKFLEKISTTALQKIQEAIQADGYHKMLVYQPNYSLIKKALAPTNQLLTEAYY